MTTIVEFARDVLGVKLYGGQAAELSAYYASDKPNWLFLAGRRSGKSLISDVIACYEAVIPDFSDVLRSGEGRYIIICSVRQDNAALHISNIARMLKHTRAIGKMIKAQLQDRLELSNGVTILALPASARAGRGFTASMVIFDELAHFVDSLGNSSADSVYDAFSPTIATFGDRGRLVITTTPASRTGIVYDLFDRATTGELDDYHITRADTRTLNPKVSERVIRNAEKRDPEAARVEYGAEFADPVAAFLDSAAIDRAIDYRNHAAQAAQSGARYVMAIDPATQRDRYAFALCHIEKGAVILDYAHAMKPPVDINAAEEMLFDLARRFKPSTIRCDTASTVQRLKSKLSQLEYTPFTRPLKLRIFGSLKESLNAGNLILYNHAELIDELRALQIRNGVDIAAPKSGRITHDDLADCLALCVDALIAQGAYGPATVVKDPFAEWPYQDGESYHPQLGIGEWNWNPHPAGVTYRNCRYRNKGCVACYEEMEVDGTHAADEAVARAKLEEGTPEPPPPQPPDYREIRAGEFLRMFIRNARGKR